MQFPKPLASDVGVDLGRGQISVAEQHLHDPEIRAVVEQMRRKRMSEHVRRERLTDAGVARVTLHEYPEHLSRHGFSALGDEERIGLASAKKRGPCLVKIPLDPVQRFLSHG